MLAGKKFRTNEEVIAETEAYFEAKDKSFYESDERQPSSYFDLNNVEQEYEETCGLENGYIYPDHKKKDVEVGRKGKQVARLLASAPR
ncbi:hypothetical protein Trydic_g17720 [Trypoxylus dichotomus]